jgi:hypothetical protein
MEEQGRRRLTFVAVTVAGILYFFVCAFPLPKTLVLRPAWSKDVVSQSTPFAGLDTTPLIPFLLGGRYGYFSADGERLFSAAAPYGVALAPDAYAPYERLSEGFQVMSPSGATLARVPSPGYPFFAAGRRFLVGPDQASFSELGADGKATWSYEFGSVITCCSASPTLVSFGLMDGSIVALGNGGEELLRFSPGGSRIECVYGIASAPNGSAIAAVCGLDQQRLVVLEKRAAEFRVAYHRWLGSEFRRPVKISFVPDGSRLVFELPGGAGIYERVSGLEYFVETDAAFSIGKTAAKGFLLLLVSGAGEIKRLTFAYPPFGKVLETRMRSLTTFVDSDGDAIFLGADGRLMRLDLEEE